MKSKSNKTLELIALIRVIDSRLVTAIFNGSCNKSSARAKFINYAVEKNKFLKKHVIRGKYNNTEKAITYYSITRKGLAYISNQGHEFFQIIDMSKPWRIFERSEQTRKAIKRQLILTTGIIMSWLAGAVIDETVWTDPYLMKDPDTEDDEDMAFDDLDDAEYENGFNNTGKTYWIKDYYRAYIDQTVISDILQYDQNNSDIIFYSAARVKRTAAQVSAEGSVIDFVKGRYAGILDSKHKCLLLYSTDITIMQWDSHLVKAELSAYSFWTRTNAIASQQQLLRNGTTAALFVSSPRDFYNQFNLHKKGCDMGGSFSHLYIVPKSDIGAKFLRWIMLLDDKTMNDQMTEYLDANGLFVKSNNHHELFPLRDKDGNETFLGFMLDAKLIARLCRVAGANAKLHYVVCCYDWQEDYYKQVLPENVLYYKIPMRI